MRNIYVSTACVRFAKIAESIRSLAEQGFRHIELSGGTKPYQRLEEDLIRLKKEYSLIYACHGYFPPPEQDFVVNLASGNEEIYKKSIRHYLMCMDMMERVGIKDLSLHAGFLIEIPPEQIGRRIDSPIIYNREESVSRFCDAYNEIVKNATARGMNVYLENNVISRENYEQFNGHNYLLMTDYATICEMKQILDFNLLLDLGHLHVSSHTLGHSFEEEVRQLACMVKWLHVSENDGIVDEHRMLDADSKIQRACSLFSDCNITLETVGAIEHIRESYQMIMGCGQ